MLGRDVYHISKHIREKITWMEPSFLVYLLQRLKFFDAHATAVNERTYYHVKNTSSEASGVVNLLLKTISRANFSLGTFSRQHNRSTLIGRRQRTYRKRYRFRVRRAAILIQSWWRIKTGTDLVTRSVPGREQQSAECCMIVPEKSSFAI